jgi:hypothetical protein
MGPSSLPWVYSEAAFAEALAYLIHRPVKND